MPYGKDMVDILRGSLEVFVVQQRPENFWGGEKPLVVEEYVMPLSFRVVRMHDCCRRMLSLCANVASGTPSFEGPRSLRSPEPGPGCPTYEAEEVQFDLFQE